MQPPTPETLLTLLTQCDEATDDDRDELLTDLLVRIYPTRQTQDA